MAKITELVRRVYRYEQRSAVEMAYLTAATASIARALIFWACCARVAAPSLTLRVCRRCSKLCNKNCLAVKCGKAVFCQDS